MKSLDQLHCLCEGSHQEWGGVLGSALTAHDATRSSAGMDEGQEPQPEESTAGPAPALGEWANRQLTGKQDFTG